MRLPAQYQNVTEMFKHTLHDVTFHFIQLQCIYDTYIYGYGRDKNVQTQCVFACIIYNTLNVIFVILCVGCLNGSAVACG